MTLRLGTKVAAFAFTLWGVSGLGSGQGAPPPPRKPPAPVRPPTSLEVVVQGPGGKPVAGALVIVSGWADPLRSRRSGGTDGEGRLRLDGLARPPWDVAVQATGLAPKSVARVGGEKPLVVRLEPGAVVTGVVRDAVTRDPVAGARVWALLALPDRWNPEAGRVSARSDARGRFRLEGLGRGSLTIEAAAAGHGYARLSNPRPGPAGIELFLQRGAGLAGLVRDDAGRPVKGAGVHVFCVNPRSSGPQFDRSDGMGRFAFSGLAAGKCTLVAREGSRAPAVALVQVEPEGDTGADLTLSEGGFVTGRLVDARGKPLRGRVVVTEFGELPLPPVLLDLMQADAGADGRFALGPVPVTALAIEAVAPGFAPRAAEARVEPGSRTADLGDVTLDAGLTIRGFVRDSQGVGVAGAAVRGFFRSSRPPEAVTEEDGSFVLAGLSPGSVRIVAHLPGYVRAASTAETGAEDVELVLEAGGTIVGGIVDARGLPVDGAAVTAQPEADDSGIGMVAATADEPGARFVLRDVGPGPHILVARAPGHTAGTTSRVRVVAGRETDAGLIRLRPGGRVRGIVVDAESRAVPGATARLEGEGGRGLPTPTQTDGAGAFEFAGVPSGAAEVVVLHPSFAPARAPVVIDTEGRSDEVRVVMSRGGRVEGHVRRRTGAAFSGAVVTVFSRRQDEHRWNSVAGPVEVAEDGSFSAEHVPPGPVSLNVGAPSAGVPTPWGAGRLATVLKRDLDVRESETTAVEITTREVVVSGRVTRAGEPVAGVEVSFRGQGSHPAYGWLARPGEAPGPQPLVGTTREDGGYELLVFEPGRYQAMASKDGAMTPLRLAGGHAWAIEVPDVAVHTVDFALAAASLAGIVVEEGSSNPIARAHVSLSGSRGGSHGETGANGRFQLDAEPGEAILHTFAEGFVRVQRPLTIEASGVTDLRIELARGLTIAGRVVDALGRPMGDLAVFASAEQELGIVSAGRVLPDGSFRLRGVREGSHVLVTGSDGLGYALQAGVSAGASDVLLTVRPAATLRVHVVDSSGVPAEGAHLRVAAIGGIPVTLPGRSGRTTDEAGNAEIKTAEGVSTLEVFDRRGHARTSVEARGGDTVSVEIALSRVPERRPGR